MKNTTIAMLSRVSIIVGTSRAFRACFVGDSHLAINSANVLGVLSLIFWSLVFVVSVKYLVFVMRADRDGEGGILALMSVLSAIEGVHVATDKFDHLVIPTSIVILFAMFWFQKKGTAKIGRLFGPAMVITSLLLFLVDDPSSHFHIPPEQVVEIGMRLPL